MNQKEEFDCPDSRFLKRVTYNKDTLELSVHMERAGEATVYTCINVPKFVYNGFKEATSKGSFFNKNIRGKYKHKYFK